MQIEFRLKNKEGKVIKESNQDDKSYIALHHNFALGDYFEIKVAQVPSYLMVQLNPEIMPALIYLKKPIWIFQIPFHLQRESAYAPTAFQNRISYAWVRYATKDEINGYCNLSVNSHDQHQDSGAYPHASANIETNNLEVFYARNAIDGILANEHHGNYPFQSWGIGGRKDACIKIDFGRNVKLNKIGIVLRADYPHDSYWKSGRLKFSNGSEMKLNLKKTADEQYFRLDSEVCSWISLDQLAMSDDVGFRALTQIETFGQNI